MQPAVGVGVVETDLIVVLVVPPALNNRLLSIRLNVGRPEDLLNTVAQGRCTVLTGRALLAGDQLSKERVDEHGQRRVQFGTSTCYQPELCRSASLRPLNLVNPTLADHCAEVRHPGGVVVLQ